MTKKIKKVWVNSKCVGCGTCEIICPSVFEIENVSRVKENPVIEGNEDKIREAAQTCPAGAIEIEEE